MFLHPKTGMPKSSTQAMDRKIGLALRDENKWQMVLRNIPGLKKCDSQKGKRKETLAKSYSATVTSEPEKACRMWLRTDLWYQDTGEFRCSLFCHLCSYSFSIPRVNSLGGQAGLVRKK